MHKVIFKINKFGDKVVDRDITIISLELDLEYVSKNEIKIPDIGSDFIIGNEEFKITRKVDSIQKNEDDTYQVKIVFLELKRLKPIQRTKMTYTDLSASIVGGYHSKNLYSRYTDPDDFFNDI